MAFRAGWPPTTSSWRPSPPCIGSALALHLAGRDGASRRHTAYAIASAYLGALVGGYLFEALRAVPAAVAAGSWRPVLHPGRAAYGGLLFAIGAAALYLHRARQPLAPFFDRVAIGVGLTFALVRTGCFLAGCDYGVPTAHSWGVRFPPGSLAALDHARRGFVPRGASSLPVHPTQLYEVAVGLVAAVLAAIPVLRGRRDGRAICDVPRRLRRRTVRARVSPGRPRPRPGARPLDGAVGFARHRRGAGRARLSGPGDADGATRSVGARPMGRPPRSAWRSARRGGRRRGRG